MQRIYWNFYTSHERNQIIFEIPRLINHCGTIIHQSMFSDYCLNLTIEITSSEIPILQNMLSKYFKIDEHIRINKKSQVIIFISIKFNNATGEQKNIIPQTPG